MSFDLEEYLNDRPYLKELFLKDPEFKAKWLITREKDIQTTIDHILKQTYYGQFAIVDVQRTECVVTITWRFPRITGSSDEYKVMGQIREMSLIPDSDHNMDQSIIDTYGQGSCRLNLSEGRSYLVVMYVFDDTKSEKLGTSEHGGSCIDCITFQVVVPLSDAHKVLLNEVSRRPEERVKHALGRFLDIEDTFDNELKNGIDRIKQKHLSPDDEEEQISRFIEYATLKREKMGL